MKMNTPTLAGIQRDRGPQRWVILSLLASLMVCAFRLSIAAETEAGIPLRERSLPEYYSTYPVNGCMQADPIIKMFNDKWLVKVMATENNTEAYRKLFEDWYCDSIKLNERVAKWEDREVPGSNGAIRVRIYTPEGERPFPIVFYIHGGGWTYGSVNTHDDLCRSLCHRAGALVVAVDYHRAPEHPYPQPLEDCFTALKWTANNAEKLGGDLSFLTVAGDSAGGNLAAGLVLYVRDKGGPQISFQVLCYPALDASFNAASYWENAAGYFLTRTAAIRLWGNYILGPNPDPTKIEDQLKQCSDYYAMPLKANNFKGLPPALILTAQFDPVRYDGETYAARLHQAGVPVLLTRYLAMDHGFIQRPADLNDARHAIQQIADMMRAIRFLEKK